MRKTGNWGLIRLMLNKVSSSTQQAEPPGNNFLMGMRQTRIIKITLVILFKQHKNVHNFDIQFNKCMLHSPSHSLSLATYSYNANYQQIAVMTNDSLLQCHYTNGSPFYYVSFCDVHGHNRGSEIHLPWQSNCIPYVRGRLYGLAIAEGSISQP